MQGHAFMDSLNSFDFCSKFIDKTINNKKGLSFNDRFIDILSDPNNLFINRCEKAGTIENGHVFLHNGIKVETFGYYPKHPPVLGLRCMSYYVSDRSCAWY